MIRSALAAVGGISVLLATGCRQDMHNQPKFYPQRGTSFYADGRSVRPQVADTVARNQMHQDSYFYTGFSGGKEGDGMPFPVTMQVMRRGQERYNVYCTPCHSRVGNGVGMIVQRGYSQAGNLHSQRLVDAPLGHFFNVISNGYGAMPDYSAQVTTTDRWAIAAYIRALQLSQDAKPSDVPSGAHVEPLAEITEREGFPSGFASDWVLPPTATPATAMPAAATYGPSAGPMPGPAGPGAPAAPSSVPASAAPAAPRSQLSPTRTSTPVAAKLSPAGFVKGQAGEASGKASGGSAPAGSVAAGHALYEKNCQMCHQPTMLGMPPAIPSLIGAVDRVGAAKIHSIVHNGNAPMPAFPSLTPADIDNIIAYLATNTKAAPKGIRFPAPAASAPTKMAANKH